MTDKEKSLKLGFKTNIVGFYINKNLKIVDIDLSDSKYPIILNSIDFDVEHCMAVTKLKENFKELLRINRIAKLKKLFNE